MNKKLLIIILLVLCIAVPVMARPLTDYYGDVPRYDSGWVLAESWEQEFDLELDERVLTYALLVADDEYGNNPTMASPAYRGPEGGAYGYIVTEVQGIFSVIWLPAGIGYHKVKGWYQRSTDYCRLLVYDTDTPSRIRP